MAAVLPSRPRLPAAPILPHAGHDAASTSLPCFPPHSPAPASILPEGHYHHLGHHSRFGWTDPLGSDPKIPQQRQQHQQQQRQHQHQQHLDENDQRASSLDDLGRRESERQQRRAHALQLTVMVVDSARASTDRRLSADRDATLAHATRLVDYRDPNYHDSCDAEFLRTCHEVEGSSGTSASSSSNGNGNSRERVSNTDCGGDDVCDDDDDDLLDIDLQALRTHARFGSASAQRPLAGNRETAGAPGPGVPAAPADAAAATVEAGASCCCAAEGATTHEAAACVQLYPDLDSVAGVADVTGDLVLLPWALESRKTGAVAHQSSAFHDSVYEGPGQLRLRQRQYQQHQHQHQQEHLRQRQHQQNQHGSQDQQQPVLDRSVTVPATPFDGGSAAYRHYVARTSTDTEPDSAESARLQLVAAEFRLFEVRKMLAAIRHDKSSSRHRLAGPAVTAAAGSAAGCCDDDGAGTHSTDRVASDAGVPPHGDAVFYLDGGRGVDGAGGGSMRGSKSRQGGHHHPLIHHTRSASTPNPSEDSGSSLPYSSATAAAADGCKQLMGRRSLPPLARRSAAKSRFHSHQGMGVGSPDSTGSSADGKEQEDDDESPQVVGCMLPGIFFRRKASVNSSRSSGHHNSFISNSR